MITAEQIAEAFIATRPPEDGHEAITLDEAPDQVKLHFQRAADYLNTRAKPPQGAGSGLAAADDNHKALVEALRVEKAAREAAEKAAKSASADADMYANAWDRELRPYGIRRKVHHIDEMVVTTRGLVAQAMKARETLAIVEQWKADTVVARTLGVDGPDLLAAFQYRQEGEQP